MKFKIYLIVVLLNLICFRDSYSEVIQYEHILSDALKFSHKLLEAELDRDIKDYTLSEVKYLKYPELSLKVYSEYEKNLAGDSGLTSIGGDVLSDTSQFHNTAYLDLSYKLYDYGIREREIVISEIDVHAARAIVKKTRMDVEKAVLELYATILLLTIEIDKRNGILELMGELNRIRKKIAKAGIVDQLTVMNREIELEERYGKQMALEFELLSRLEDLSLYTGVVYDVKALKVRPFAFECKGGDEIDYKKLPGYKYYEDQYQMKKERVEIEKKKFFPGVDFYMRYSCYGADDNDYFKSVEDFREKNFKIGLNMTIPLVENLKRRHSVSRLHSEMMKADVLMKEKYEELRILFEKMKKNYSYYQKDLKHKQKLLSLVKEKVDMVTRLINAEMIDLEQGLEQKIALFNQELDLEKQIVERMSAIKQIMIQQQGAM